MSAGHNWFSYAPLHMDGFAGARPYAVKGGLAGIPHKPGHILHDVLETRVMPRPRRPGGARQAALHRDLEGGAAPDRRPVKFGTITAELIAMAVRDLHYKDLRKRILAVSDALNEELHELADAGCKVIQMEEPQIHLLAAQGARRTAVLNADFMVEVFNNTVRGLRAKTEVWCHTCWGNPPRSGCSPRQPSYAPALDALNRVDADVITFETCSSGGMDLEAIGRRDHATRRSASASSTTTRCRSRRRSRSPRSCARRWSTFPPERLVLGSDCGMGREGMSRRHAFYKMVSIVLGTNLVRRELGLARGAVPGRGARDIR